MLLGKNRVIRRRAVVGLLVVASLVLLSLSYRQGSTGAVGDVQRSVSTVTAPAAGVVHQITQPFADAWSWTTGLINARDEAAQVQQLKQQLSVQIVLANTYQQRLRQAEALLQYKHASGFETVGATVVSRSDPTDSQIVIDQGTSAGITAGDPVVAPLVKNAKSQNQVYSGALVGVVMAGCGANACPVRLITDQSSGVGYTARVLNTEGAQGILQPSAGSADIFDLTMVKFSVSVPIGGIVTTAGINSSRLPSRIPPGIPIGRVLSVSDDDFGGPSKNITVEPFADFQALGDVIVVKVPPQ